MKYSQTNPPLVCIQRGSTCYRGTSRMTPRGVLWHSTGCNNPHISRYVQPLETDGDYAEMLAILGKNRYGNDWNHKPRQAGMNCFIGKLADGTVATVQTMPWDYAPWGCGSGKRGSLNNTHMQFEICEDDLTDEAYFQAVYREACEVTAFYCAMYGLDPLGTFQYKGVEVPVITTHDESYDLGLGSNHGDPIKWLKKFGKTMDDARRDVAALMGIVPAPKPRLLPSLGEGSEGQAVKALQTLLTLRGCKTDADGIFGPKTRKATEKFQKQTKLPVTGRAEDADWLALVEGKA